MRAFRTIQHRFLVALLGAASASSALTAQISVAEYAARREALGKISGDAAVVVLGAGEPAKDFELFSQSPHLRYLTGWMQPNGALVLVRTNGQQREILFVEERNAAGEVWTGVRPSLLEARQVTGIETRTTADLTAVLDSVAGAALPIRVIGEFQGQRSVAGEAVTPDQVFLNELSKRRPASTVTDGNRLVLQLRATKSAAEIALLRTAIGITVQAHEEAMRMVAPGWNEFEIQALVEYVFRRDGAERPGFTSIAGSGDNGTTLHYWRNDRATKAGELVVMDIGASYAGYSADVTRTLPIGGRFTPAQRAVYELVRRAQVAAETATRVGAAIDAPGLAAFDTLASGLAALGLIESPTATYDCDTTGQRQCRQVRLYYMHALGHGIGLDVHDPDLSDTSAVWLAGSVVTIEPGVYVRRNLAEVLPDTPRNRALMATIAPALAIHGGIGVRIEDDYLLTASGLEWLSKLPREVAEVEQAMRRPRASAPRPRDAALVGRYPRGTP